MIVASDSYVLTLRPGVNAAAAAKGAATYIINRWMPGNAGGVHLMLTPHLTRMLVRWWEMVNLVDHPAEVRVTIENNRPVLTVLESTWTKP